jgi:3-oxoacyl-[acyl-carrier protein] reductase
MPERISIPAHADHCAGFQSCICRTAPKERDQHDIARENMTASNGRAALVTGASRGIGKAIALRLAADGFAVGVNYRSGSAEADQVVGQIVAAGGRAIPLQADVGVTREATRLVEDAAAQLGGLDVLVNNAGLGITDSLMNTTEEAYDRLFDLARGVFFAMQRAGRVLRDNGRIINISSISTRQAAAMPAYAASKLAIEQFARGLAHEIGHRGITVNAVLPGGTDTEMFATLGPEQRQRAAESTALGRLGQPEDIAEVVAFLASDAGRWITAETITASGGRRIG